MQDFFLHRDDNIVVPPVFAGNKKRPPHQVSANAKLSKML